MEQGESVAVWVLEDREPSDVRNLFLALGNLRSKIRGFGEGLVDVDYAEMVEKSCFAHGLPVESAHGLVLTGVLVRYEPVVHWSHWDLGNFPAEKLLVKASYFLRLVGRDFEVH